MDEGASRDGEEMGDGVEVVKSSLVYNVFTQTISLHTHVALKECRVISCTLGWRYFSRVIKVT